MRKHWCSWNIGQTYDEKETQVFIKMADIDLNIDSLIQRLLEGNNEFIFLIGRVVYIAVIVKSLIINTC